MPRYRVVLEFDHPGDGMPIEDHSTTNNPSRWDWAAHLPSSDCSNIRAQIYEEIYEFRLLDEKHYSDVKLP